MTRFAFLLHGGLSEELWDCELYVAEHLRGRLFWSRKETTKPFNNRPRQGSRESNLVHAGRWQSGRHGYPSHVEFKFPRDLESGEFSRWMIWCHGCQDYSWSLDRLIQRGRPSLRRTPAL